jgi:hypothetical protein
LVVVLADTSTTLTDTDHRLKKISDILAEWTQFNLKEKWQEHWQVKTKAIQSGKTLGAEDFAREGMLKATMQTFNNVIGTFTRL